MELERNRASSRHRGPSIQAVLTLFCLLAALQGCSKPGAQSSHPTPVGTPAESTPVSTALPQKSEAVARATEAFKDFGEKLKRELQEAIAAGGPVNAVNVCYEVAPKLAEENSLKHGFEMGRSSHRLRNSGNVPLPAVAGYLEKYAQAGAQAPVEAFEEGGSWIVVAPIVAQPLCLTCHGDASTFSPELKSALAAKYPDDKATGFKAGDLRGVFWARIRSSAP